MTTRELIREIKKSAKVLRWHPWLMVVTLALTLGVAFFEALGAGMVIPILQSVQGQEIDSFFIRYAHQFLQHLSLPYTFLNLMIVFLGFLIAVPIFTLLYLRFFSRESWVLSISLTTCLWLAVYFGFVVTLGLPF